MRASEAQLGSRNRAVGAIAHPWHPCNPWFLLHEELTESVIGAAMTVLNELRPDLNEKLYENALVIELRARGHRVEQQTSFSVHYRGHFIGKLVPDLIVEQKLVVDPKVAEAFSSTHIAQMLGYLNITGMRVALLLNFKRAQLDWKRVML